MQVHDESPQSTLSDRTENENRQPYGQVPSGDAVLILPIFSYLP